MLDEKHIINERSSQFSDTRAAVQFFVGKMNCLNNANFVILFSGMTFLYKFQGNLLEKSNKKFTAARKLLRDKNLNCLIIRFLIML